MKNNTKIHGLVSLIIFEITIAISIYAIALKSFLFAAIYFAGSIAAACTILFLFCSKCTAKENCSHVYPGHLAKIFPDKSKEKYEKTDYLGTGIALAFVFITPLFWLWSNKILFIGYWFLTIIAAIQINQFVCKKCDNSKCTMCKKG